MESVPRSFVEDLRRRGITDERTLTAMATVPRHLFVPEDIREYAYDDRALPIDCRQTISQPFIVAWMTQLLQLEANDRVLEIGTGSGYQTAVLAELCDRVITIERHEHLASDARELLSRLGYRNIEFHVGDGSLGWPDSAPYNACLVAAASPGIPKALAEQLVIGGRLVIPVGSTEDQNMLLVVKGDEGRLLQQSCGGCRFVKLIGRQGWEESLEDVD